MDIIYKPIDREADGKILVVNGAGNTVPSPYFIYLAAKYAREYFKRLIFEYDMEDKYSREKVGSYVDTEAIAELQGPYKVRIEQVSTAYEKYIELHPEEYKEISVITGNLDDDERAELKAFIPDRKFSLSEAVEGYKTAAILVKRFESGGDMRDNLDLKVAHRSLNEYREKHKQVKLDLCNIFGVPEDVFFASDNHPEFKKTETRRVLKIKANGSPDEEPFEDYFKEFLESEVR